MTRELDKSGRNLKSFLKYQICQWFPLDNDGSLLHAMDLSFTQKNSTAYCSHSSIPHMQQVGHQWVFSALCRVQEEARQGVSHPQKGFEYKINYFIFLQSFEVWGIIKLLNEQSSLKLIASLVILISHSVSSFQTFLFLGL